MKMFDITSWKPSQRKVFEKNLPIYAEGSTYRNHYVVTFASPREMEQKISKGIVDENGKKLNIQSKVCKKVGK